MDMLKSSLAILSCLFIDLCWADSGYMTAKISLYDEERLCLSLELTNISNEDYFIVRPSMSASYKKSNTTFVIKDTKGNQMKYIGPIVNSKRKSFNMLVYIPAGETDRSRFCLPKYYQLNKDIHSVQYSAPMGYMIFDMKPSGRSIEFLKQVETVESNKIEVKWHEKMADTSSYPTGFAPYGIERLQQSNKIQHNGKTIIVD